MMLCLRRLFVLSVVGAAMVVAHVGEIPEPEPIKSADGSPLDSTGAYVRTDNGDFVPLR